MGPRGESLVTGTGKNAGDSRLERAACERLASWLEKYIAPSMNSEVPALYKPPREPGGYALMVDGRASPTTPGTLRVTPTRALLHRRAKPGSAVAELGCLHDCVVFEA